MKDSRKTALRVKGGRQDIVRTNRFSLICSSLYVFFVHVFMYSFTYCLIDLLVRLFVYLFVHI